MPDPGGQSRAASLIESLADPALTVDARGRVLAWNAAASRRLGLDAGWVGRPFAELAPDDGLGVPVRLRLGDAVAESLIAWTAPGGPAARRPADADAAALLRARAMERLAGSAWHELAQPLGGLRGFVSMLQIEGWTQDQLGVDPALIEQAVVTAERLTRTLTDLARGGSRALPLRAVVADLLALAGHLLVDVAVEVDIADDVPEPDVDPAIVRIAAAALLVDRIAALGGPRSARGRMRWSARDEASADGHVVALLVEDDGPAQTTPSLAPLSTILEAVGASLRQARAAAGGSRLEIRFPVRQTADGPAPAPGGRPPDRPMTVLVCDDESAVRSLLVRVLERNGIRALGAGTGDEALALLDREAVDVVLADHHMAGMTGRDLHTAAAVRHPHLRERFVLMSGDATDADLMAFAEAARLPVLAKPFELTSLPRVLREVAAR